MIRIENIDLPARTHKTSGMPHKIEMVNIGLHFDTPRSAVMNGHRTLTIRTIDIYNIGFIRYKIDIRTVLLVQMGKSLNS